MSHRYVTVTVETRPNDFYSDNQEVPSLSTIYNLDLETDAAQIEAGVHEDIQDHLLNLLEQYREDNP